MNATLNGVEDVVTRVPEALLSGTRHDSQEVKENIHRHVEML
jgi:hypothetical protein